MPVISRLTLVPIGTAALVAAMICQPWPLLAQGRRGETPPTGAREGGNTRGEAPETDTRDGGSGPRLPSDYAIGPDDALTVMVWREKDLSMDVVVRPDGNITLPLINDIQAAGLKPEQLRARIDARLRAFVKDPIVTVIVRQVNSRKVFITGRVLRPGAYALLTPLRAVDLIALAGGVLASADARHITILRSEPEGRVALPMDYTRVIRGEVLWQDVVLRPGDAIVVP